MKYLEIFLACLFGLLCGALLAMPFLDMTQVWSSLR
jgi:hypothetical protein